MPNAQRQPDRAILLGAVADIISTEETARTAADRELATEVARLRARLEGLENAAVPAELAAQLETVRRLLDEPPPPIPVPEPPPVPRRLIRTDVNRDGELVVSYSDGMIERLGNVMGPRGCDGVSIVAAARNEAGELMLTLSDGTVLTP